MQRQKRFALKSARLPYNYSLIERLIAILPMTVTRLYLDLAKRLKYDTMNGILLPYENTCSAASHISAVLFLVVEFMEGAIDGVKRALYTKHGIL